MPFLKRLTLLFSLTLILQSLPIFANPIANPSHPFTPNYKIPQAAGTELLPVTHNTALTKRATNTYYNNLGVWHMVLTTATAIVLGRKVAPSPAAAEALKAFLIKIAAGAASRARNNYPESDVVILGEGAISLAFTLRGHISTTTTQTIPWALVQTLTTQFLNRVVAGNAEGFTGVVTGPLQANDFYKPWIKVVLEVGGAVLLDGVPFEIGFYRD